MTRFSKITFGAGLNVTDDGGGAITVSSSGGGGDVSGKVDRDAVEAATARLVQVKLAAADTQPAFQIRGNGVHVWGPGGTTPIDTSLYRSAAGTLKTDGVLLTGDRVEAAGNVISNSGAAGQIILGGDGHIYFTNATDTAIYRGSAGVVKTDGGMSCGHLRTPPATRGLGTYAGKSIPIYDIDGTHLGYLPIYAG